MGIKLGIQKTVEVEAKFVTVHAKVRDSGSYELLAADGSKIATRDDDYVPNEVIPGEYGDYIELKIDLETGQIANWKVPSAEAIAKAFKTGGDTDE